MKRTVLYEKHLSLGARMVPFAGWEMPIQYHSIVQEHLGVRQEAGLFDVSHMGEIMVKGRQALELLETLSCNDVSKLESGQVQYNCILNREGGIVDDILIYCLEPDVFFIVSNAANYEGLCSYIQDFAQQRGFEAQISNESEKWQQLALQGPKAQIFLEEEIGQGLGDLAYFCFRDFTIEGHFLRISRTGYTGEDGFEIYGDAAAILWLWEKLLAGQSKTKGKSLLPAGLGARDSLRLEAFYPLYGQELNPERTPVESGLAWLVKRKKKTYLGYKLIMEHKKNGPPGRVLGFQLKAEGIARSGYSVWDNLGIKKISKVLSGAYSPILKKGIGSLYLPEQYTQLSQIQLEIRNKLIPAELCTGPFVKLNAGKNKSV